MKLRKILCGVTAAAIAFGSLATYAQTPEGNADTSAQSDSQTAGEYVKDGIKYSIGSETVSVMGPVDKSITAANIPDEIEGKPVTSISDCAFMDCDKLSVLTLPEELKTIGVSAFENCVLLTTVRLPSTVEKLSNRAFRGCTGLNNIMLNTGLKSIGSYCFEECDSLIGVGLPQTVESIGDSVFTGCDKLVGIDITLGKTENNKYLAKDHVLYEIPQYAPDERRIIAYPRSKTNTSFTIESDVTSIDGDVAHSKYLKSFAVQSGNKSYAAQDGILFSAELDEIYIYPPQKSETEYTVPDGVSIGNRAFSGTAQLEKVIIPKYVTNVPHNAFVYGSEISSVKNIVYEGSMEEWMLISSEFNGKVGVDDMFIYDEIEVTCTDGIVDKNGKHPIDSDYEKTVFLQKSDMLGLRIRCSVEKGAFESEPNFFAAMIYGEGEHYSLNHFDISFTDSDGNRVEPKGGCTLRVSGYSGRKFYVYRIGSDGKYTELSAPRLGDDDDVLGGEYIEFFMPTTGEILITTEKQVTEAPPVSSSSTSSTKPEEPPVSSSSTSSTVPEEPPVSSTTSSTTPAELPVSSSATTSTSAASEPAESVPAKETVYTPEIIDSSFDASTAEIVKGIRVIMASGALESGAILTVKPDPDYTADGYAFDITFTKDGVEVQPNGAVSVEIPVPEELKGKGVYVYHVEGGKFALVESKIENDFVKFSVSHFSTYVITAEKLDGASEPSNSNPVTGIAVTVVPVALIAGTVLVIFKKKK